MQSAVEGQHQLLVLQIERLKSMKAPFVLIVFSIILCFQAEADNTVCSRSGSPEDFVGNICALLQEQAKNIESKESIDEKYDLAFKCYLEYADRKISELYPNSEAKCSDQLEKIANNITPLCVLAESIERIWSEEHAQRKNGPLSLGELAKAADTLAELKTRIFDPDDPLIDIANYKRLLLIPSYSGQIYNWVEKLYFTREKEKAYNCFEFFLLPENTDEFTIGAALFFLGRCNKNGIPKDTAWEERLKMALPRLLAVQRYPTCLTYISYAYFFAGQIYVTFGYYKQAVALFMIDVPSVDLAVAKEMRHMEAFSPCCNCNDVTNALKHIHEWSRYTKDKNKDSILNGYKQVFSEALWNYCATNLFTAYDKHIALKRALEDDRKDIPEFELLEEALLHPWPNIDQIPANIATNRVLNNNVF